MIRRTSFPVDSEESTELLQKLRRELRTPVGDYGFWGPIVFEDVLGEQLCNSFGIRYAVRWDEPPHLGESVHYNQDCIVTFIADR